LVRLGLPLIRLPTPFIIPKVRVAQEGLAGRDRSASPPARFFATSKRCMTRFIPLYFASYLLLSLDGTAYGIAHAKHTGQCSPACSASNQGLHRNKKLATL